MYTVDYKTIDAYIMLILAFYMISVFLFTAICIADFPYGSFLRYSLLQ